jgi:hypothetical protein
MFKWGMLGRAARDRRLQNKKDSHVGKLFVSGRWLYLGAEGMRQQVHRQSRPVRTTRVDRDESGNDTMKDNLINKLV